MKEEFYSDLCETTGCVLSDDWLIILMGDINARVGSDTEKWKGVLGSHGVTKCNANGELLLVLCSEFNLVVAKPYLSTKTHKKLWIHPRFRR